jgi:hypothetical protein
MTNRPYEAAAGEKEETDGPDQGEKGALGAVAHIAEVRKTEVQYAAEKEKRPHRQQK